MNKPITVARQEFIDGVVKCINSSPLPSFVMAEALRQILPFVDENVKKEYDADLTRYNEGLQATDEKQTDTVEQTVTTPAKKKKG